uniref:NADH-ubiquinone oxidoreductase chain 4L n=1 Tax=Penthimia melanocephala TaxID=2777567 RepID=A0A7L8UV80_9HEMI|nr:NADH dehydrogenase subunit 4L [Penthimia melanocephala]QOG08897.1 NADH dehydrogenase subunit 4L [Penthimia melanocephala]
MYYLMVYIVFMSIISLILVRKHIFLCLLSLEFIVISLLLMYINYFMMYSYGLYLMILMMVFFVCEGVLGLSVLVSMIRLMGNDYLSSMYLW